MSFPPLSGFATFDDDANNEEDDFIEKMALQLNNDIDRSDFILMMEHDLYKDFFRQNDVLEFGLPMSVLDNGFFLGGLEDTINITNTQQQHRRVCGKC